MADHTLDHIPQTPRLLRSYLSLRGLKVKQLAAVYGTSGSWISRILLGRRAVSPAVVLRLRAAVARAVQSSRNGEQRDGGREEDAEGSLH